MIAPDAEYGLGGRAWAIDRGWERFDMTTEHYSKRVDLGPTCYLTDQVEPPVVAITGEVDVSNAGRLRSALFDIAQAQPPLVVLETGGLTFLDARGLDALLDVHHWLCDGDSRGLMVRNPTPIVRRILQLSGQEFLVEPKSVVAAGG